MKEKGGRVVDRGRWYGIVRRVASEFQNVLFPPPTACAFCGEATEEGMVATSVCDRCLRMTAVIGRQRCRRCGRATRRRGRDAEDGRHRLFLGRGGFQCGECSLRMPAVDYGRAYGVYDGYLRRLIHTLKFQGELRIARGLGEMMAWIVAADGRYGPVHGVVPVPLHPRRRRERGFNQAEELARVVAAMLRKPLLNVVVRVEDGTPQAHLPWSERRRRVERAFAVYVPDQVRGRRLLLVDDVWTTGSTLSAVARALKRAGAGRCTAICAAAGSLDGEWTDGAEEHRFSS